MLFFRYRTDDVRNLARGREKAEAFCRRVCFTGYVCTFTFRWISFFSSAEYIGMLPLFPVCAFFWFRMANVILTQIHIDITVCTRSNAIRIKRTRYRSFTTCIIYLLSILPNINIYFVASFQISLTIRFTNR